MTPQIRRFLTARFLTMLGWIVLLGAGFALSQVVTSNIHHDVIRWVTNMVTLFGSIKVGLMLQDRVLARVDPDGSLRAHVAKLGADKED